MMVPLIKTVSTSIVPQISNTMTPNEVLNILEKELAIKQKSKSNVRFLWERIRTAPDYDAYSFITIK
jgi:hypothetical protein